VSHFFFVAPVVNFARPEIPVTTFSSPAWRAQWFVEPKREPVVPTMGKPWENHGKTMGKPWESGDLYGKTMGKRWKTMGKRFIWKDPPFFDWVVINYFDAIFNSKL